MIKLYLHKNYFQVSIFCQVCGCETLIPEILLFSIACSSLAQPTACPHDVPFRSLRHTIVFVPSLAINTVHMHPICPNEVHSRYLCGPTPHLLSAWPAPYDPAPVHFQVTLPLWPVIQLLSGGPPSSKTINTFHTRCHRAKICILLMGWAEIYTSMCSLSPSTNTRLLLHHPY